MQLFSRHLGEGEPLIILHGLFGMSDNWLNIAKKLSDKYSVFLPDIRNHGQSPHSNIINYSVMAGDINEFVINNNIENPVIIGHSMGGKVAMQYALNHKNNIKTLIIVDIAPSIYDKRYSHINMLQAMLSVKPSEYSKYSDVEDILKNTIKSKQLLSSILKNLKRDNNGKLIWKLNVEAIYNSYNNLGEAIISDNIFTTKTLFIKAENSEYLKPEQYQDIYKLFPNAAIKIMPEVSHWLHAENPELFVKIVLDFLKLGSN